MSEYRLPRSVIPRRYRLSLEPDLVAGRFSGELIVAVDVLEPTSSVVLNAADLDIHEASVAGTAAAVTLDPTAERLHLDLPHELAPGPTSVQITFNGELNDKLRGFYRSTYTDADGTEQVIACTQMEPTDARRAFPCWDEPDFKAVFSVSLVIDGDLLAVSNGHEVDRTTLADGRIRITFADTIAMSTYLVAFVVGRLEATPAVDVDGVPLRVIHVPGKGHLTGLALDCGAAGLRYFRNYYALPVPGGKVDLVAVPDFASGAMENLGCITFRENLLLVDPAAATQQEEQLVVDVVSHELAHLWFGDLVTMRWWNGLWLNEAFATFMEVMACDAFRPDWERWVAYGLERTTAFDVDALVGTRPIEYPVHSPHDADGMFDVLTYQKGGSILRMLEQYLGAERFRDGIRHYLDVHAYGNTETSDLWDAIEAATGEPVRKIMDSWIWQGGYPVVSATIEGSGVVLRQQRFLTGDLDQAEPAEWAIPLLVRQQAGDATRLDRALLTGDAMRIDLLAPDAAVIVNAGSHGFYRVRYDEQLLTRLTGPLLTQLDAAERYQLVDDAWASVVSGDLDAVRFCDFLRSFGDEHDVAVWRAVLAGLGACDRLIDDEARPGFHAFVRGLVGPALLRLGITPADGESDLTRELRGALLRALSVLGDDPAATEQARTLYEASVADDHAVDPALAAAALSAVAAHGGPAEFDAIVERFEQAATPQEMLRHLYALAEFTDEALFARSLAYAISGKVRSQNAPFLLRACLSSRQHGVAAWRFVREHWADLNERFPESTIVRMVDPVRWLCTAQLEADAAAFFAEHPIPQAAKTLEQILERQRVNVALRAREADPLTARFAG